MQRVEALRSLPYTNPWIVHQGDYIGIDDAVIDTAVEFPLVWGRLSFPAKAFLGRLSGLWVFQAVLLALLGLGFCLWFWRYATRKYTSVSS